MDTHEALKNYTDNIANHLSIALHLSMSMQQLVFESEGDSDLFRKLSHYLTPNMDRWVNGAQAGNIKDLRELFERRETQKGAVMQGNSHQGDGHDVLTKPSA